MKQRILETALAAILCITVSANDGAYRSKGGIIYPMNETKISLDKELLSFNVNNRMAQVDIYFEFFNPEPSERKILIGFQAPIPTGDAHPKFSPRNLISNFRVLYEGALIPYSIKVAECQNCELKDTSALKPLVDGEYMGVFVYLFEVTFKPGKNSINHSYDFPASDNVMFHEIYNYILTTGSKWAGSAIKDFTLQVDFGKNSYFYVNDVFPKDAKWTITGTGKIGEVNAHRSYWGVHRMVRILSGKLEISAKDFSPGENIDFGIPGPYSCHPNISFKDHIIESYIETANYLSIDVSRQKEVTKEDLLILKNAIYAFHGYRFNNQELLNYFSKLEWYIPDPNMTSEKIRLSNQEQKFLNQVIQLSK